MIDSMVHFLAVAVSFFGAGWFYAVTLSELSDKIARGIAAVNLGASLGLGVALLGGLLT